MQDSERDRLTVEVCEAVSAISPAGSHLATTAARLREMVGQEVPAGDYMKEAERLLDEICRCKWAEGAHDADGNLKEAQLCEDEANKLYFTLLAHIQRGAVPDGWQVVPKEPTKDMVEAVYDNVTGGGGRAAIYAAMLSAAPAPDHFRDAAKMMAEPAEVPMPEPDYRGPAEAGDYFSGYTHTTMCAYGDAREAAGYTHAIKVIKRLRDSHQTATGECQSDCDFITAWDSAIDALRGEVK